MEDTQKQQADPEREAMIAEMLREAESTKIELPSELTKNPVLNRDAKDEPPTVVSTVSSAGYVMVWDSRTYVQAPVLYYMLPQVLRKKRADGSYRWTTNNPGKRPQRGTYKCLLHKEDPNRDHYASLGFRECPKENITSPYQVTQHMKSRHKREWESIEDARLKAERAEDRDIQRMLAEALAGKVRETVEPSQESKKSELSLNGTKEVFACPICGKEYQSKGKAYKAHVRACK
uniref:C2H2-type domain-containing protein n=1 Tax=viral metagenome TaxID=1070528 RepID=A0A6M3IIQ9_9ZZZZ